MSVSIGAERGDQAPNIVFVGTEGAGKSTSIAILAKRYGERGNGLHFNPRNRQTMKFVNNAWRTLNSRNWLPPTAPGELLKLEWNLECDGGANSVLHILDCAGQDLRLLFGEERVNGSELPERLKEIAKHITLADVVVLVVNLKDVVGEGDPSRHDDNVWAVKYAMEYVSQTGPSTHFCLVFTQIDQYKQYLRKHGSWEKVARAYLTDLQIPDSVPVLGVSAVSDTEVEEHPELGPRRVPTPGFSSEGLEALSEWITKTVQATITDKKKAKTAEAHRKAWRPALFATVLIALLTFSVGWFCFPVYKSSPIYEQVPRTKKVPYYFLGIIPWGEEDVPDGYDKRHVGEKQERVGTEWGIVVVTVLVTSSVTFGLVYLVSFQVYYQQLDKTTRAPS